MTAFAKSVITLAIAVALAYVLISLSHEAPGEPATACPHPTTVEEDAEIRQKMGRGFDQAFQAQIAQLYKVALQNYPNVEKQRQYTKTGIHHAIAAWLAASHAADAWEGCR